LVKLDYPQACVSKRSIVAFTGGVAYASPDGIIFVSTSGQVTNVTESLFNRNAWQALVPSSISAFMWDGKYFGFYNTGATTGGFVLDPAENDAAFSFLDTYATGGYCDLIQDALYLKVGTEIVKWTGGSSVMSCTWRSGVYEYTKPVNPSCAEVRATTYPLTFKLYADGALKHTQTVLDSGLFWLPGGYMADTIDVEITVPDGEVTAIFVANTVNELQGV